MKKARDPTNLNLQGFTSVKVPKLIKEKVAFILEQKDKEDFKNGSFETKRTLTNLIQNFLKDFINKNNQYLITEKESQK